MRTDGLPADEIDRLVAVRMTRQDVLRRPEQPLRFAAIVNESVLRRQVGGSAVMRGQIEHLIEMASQSAVR
ncbi:Scr1 family TA system antitoxin-like transcriptional regulator, partial [Streptomyces sp. CHA15]|uniref:Scr1 family TA system antitoxin-like transcriptional regulator n=1 Tax=Streptomyces sp. CHA15 TaxID=2841668 RepID=UPI002094B2BB